MIKEKLKSVRVKLFLVLCVVTILLVICLIAINSLVLENFYIYNKTNTIKEVYNKINKYSNRNFIFDVIVAIISFFIKLNTLLPL